MKGMLSGLRIGPPPHSSRRSGRIAASTCVESVRCLPRALPPATFPKLLQQAIKAPTLGSMGEQATSKFGKQREVKTAIGQFQASHTLPVNPCAHRESLLPVGQSFGILHEGDERKTPRNLGGLAAALKQVTKILILIQGSSLISHLEIHIPLRQDCTRYPSRFFRNSRDRVWMHGHGFLPGFIRALVLVQYLIFLSDPALAIRQQYLNGAVPVSKYAGKKRIIRYLWFGREETP